MAPIGNDGAHAPSQVDIAIVGGGLGGLALAAGLRHRGFDAHVFEGAEVLRRETSTMVGLGPNAFMALGELLPALPEDIRKRGVPVQLPETRIAVPGAEPTVATQNQRNTMMTIRWAEVHASLASFVPPEAVHCGYQAVGFEELWDGQHEGDGYTAEQQQQQQQQQEGDGYRGGEKQQQQDGPCDDGSGPSTGSAHAPGLASVTATASSVVIRFRGRPPVTARLAVGADGVFSAMRAALCPADPGPRYLGHMNWNCLLHNPGGNTVVDAHKPGQLIFTLDAPWSGDWSTQMAVSDAGGGYTFWQVRMAFPEGPSFTCDLPGGKEQQQQDQQQQRGQQDGLCEQQLLGLKLEQQAERNAPSGPDAASTLIHTTNCPKDAAALPPAAAGTGDADGDTARGGWRKGRGGLGVPGSKARVLERLKALGWTSAIPIVEASPETSIFERALYDRLPLSRWSSPGGRLLLLGDAAHAMHPGPGQGARSAFEDAHALAEALGRCWPDVGAAGREYQEARVVRTARIQLQASTNSPVPAIRAAGRPVGLSEGDMMERFLQFHRWLEQYPAHPKGVPGSRWWAPLGPEAERELLSMGWGSGGKEGVEA